MNNILRKFGNIPVSASTIGSQHPSLRQGMEKVRWLEKHGEVIRLKRGLYVVSPEITGKPLSTELMANHIYTPSYVSMSTALRYYGLIPEAVYEIQSMTIKHARKFETPYGVFSYRTISRHSFHVGVNVTNNGSYAFIIASPEKALCDLIANTPLLNLRYIKEVREYLEDDIRLDMDEFYKMNPHIFEDYITVGKKADSITTLLKYLRNGQRHI